MKKLLFAFVILATACTSQKKMAATPPPPKDTVLLKNGVDSFSYAIGLSIASFYKQQGIDKINDTLVMKALQDAEKDSAIMEEEAVNNCIMDYMQTAKAEKAAANKKAGEAFLAANKTKPGVVTLPSGLQYKIIKQGTGPKPTLSDRVKVHYHGMLTDSTVFDSSIERGEPIVLGVGGVIKGWTEALQLMPVGSKWTLYIPSDLAYGDNQAGPSIPPGSVLVFDVELLEIMK